MEDEIEEIEELEAESTEVEDNLKETTQVVDEGDSETDPEDEELVISLDGEEPEKEEDEHKEAPQWVKDLRKSSREDKKRIRDLEKQISIKKESAEIVPKLGKKPEFEDEGIDCDADVFAEKLDEWHAQKADYDKAQIKVEAKKAEDAKLWQSRVDIYEEKKSSIKVKDYDEAEEVVRDTLSVTQQGIILQAAEDPAILVYAIGKNPKKAEELKSITDPVLFTAAITRLEGKMTVGKRKAATRPEKRVNGNSQSTADSTLTKLREEAGKTGDFNKVNAYKRKLKANKK